MTTDTGMTAVGTIIETIGAETTGAGISGVEINGVESKPAGKPSAVVIGSATRIGPCGTVTRTIAVTIVASAKLRNSCLQHGRFCADLQDSNRSAIAAFAHPVKRSGRSSPTSSQRATAVLTVLPWNTPIALTTPTTINAMPIVSNAVGHR
jgi:hypothetical protein